jgi:ABC-type glycerol-3-phosphate transport system substrate-binding protein
MRKALLIALLADLAAGCGGSGKSGSGGGDTSTTAAESSSERAGQTLTIDGFGPGDDIANNRAAIATKVLAPAKVPRHVGLLRH